MGTKGTLSTCCFFSVMGQSLVLWIWRLGFDLALCPRASVSPGNGLHVLSYFYPLISQDKTSAEPGAQRDVTRADEQFSICRTRQNSKAQLSQGMFL